MDLFDNHSDPKYSQIMNRMSFYAKDHLAGSGLEMARAALNNRQLMLSEMKKNGLDWRIMDKIPLVDDLMAPITIQTLRESDKGTILCLRNEVFVFGDVISEPGEQTLYMGIHSDVLDALLSQDFERITSVRVKAHHIQAEIQGKSHIVAVSSSGMAMSSLSQPS